MKSTREVFKDVLTETGFGNYKPSEMSNSDYWMCTQKAMERYAEQVSKHESVDFSKYIRNGKDHFNNGYSTEMVYDEWIEKYKK